MNAPVKSHRHALLGAIFIAAREHGIDNDQLRDEIAHGVIGKRLSAANERELGQVLDKIKGKGSRRSSASSAVKKKFASSIQGLRDEICSLARARWGDNWDASLSKLCRRFGIEHYRFLDVAHGKEVKAAILRMGSIPQSAIRNPQSEGEATR